MFKTINNLTFNQKLVKYLTIWGVCAITLTLGGYGLYQLKKPIFITETTVQTEYVERFTGEPVVVQLDELKQGQPIKWFDYDMCVSSIQTINIKKSTIEDEPPVSINLRPYGQC